MDIGTLLESMKMYDTMQGSSFIVVDCIHKKNLFVSRHLKEMMEPDDCSLWTSHISHLLDVAHSMWVGMTVEEKQNAVLNSCTFIQMYHDRIPFFFSIKPLSWNGNGIEVLFVNLTPAPSSKVGEISCCIEGTEKKWVYNEGKWEQCQYPLLSVMEKRILCLSACGYTQSEIASMICCAVETVKTYKKRIFRKLNVRNIHEAWACFKALVP